MVTGQEGWRCLSAGKLLAIELDMWERKSVWSEWEFHVLSAHENAGEKWKKLS